jgi:hypothetical protein
MKKIVLMDIVQRSNTRPHGDMAAELLTRIRQVPEEGIARKEKGEKGKRCYRKVSEQMFF